MDDDLASVFPSDPLPPTAALDPGSVDEYLGMQLFPNDDYLDPVTSAAHMTQPLSAVSVKEDHGSDKEASWDQLWPFPPFSPEPELSSFMKSAESVAPFMPRSPLPSPPSTDSESVHSPFSSSDNTLYGDLPDYPSEPEVPANVVDPMQLWSLDPVWDAHPLSNTFDRLTALTRLPKTSLSDYLESTLDNIAAALRAWPPQRTSQYPGDNTIRFHIHQLLCNLADCIAYQEGVYETVRQSILVQDLLALVLHEDLPFEVTVDDPENEADGASSSSSDEEEEEVDQEDEEYEDLYSQKERQNLWERTTGGDLPRTLGSNSLDMEDSADKEFQSMATPPLCAEDEEDEEEEEEEEEEEDVDVMSEDDEDYETISYSGSRRSSNHPGRKTRKNYKPEQTKILMTFYLTHDGNTPDVKSKAYLAKETGLSVGQISTWFQNARRRQKDKLQKFKELSENYPEDVYDYNSFTRFTEHKLENSKKRRYSEQQVPVFKRRK
ncbi:hypothetical protein DFQ28_010316 [Apophysomyces sp. BC1034]|nr:hypothetical protein DFQ29_008137 [Apophysomyces sp. BC1021]KAG0192045.1 hypothetical protein DFQ28_010316 [Apophysomyces sp. BC1034]